MSFTNPDTIHRASVGTKAPAAWGDIVNDLLNFLYGDMTYTNATLTNSWTALSGYSTPGFRLQGTVVRLRGAVTGGTTGTAAFTLPTGYRPPATCILDANGSANTKANASISTAGVVTITGGPGVWLDGLTFDTLA